MKKALIMAAMACASATLPAQAAPPTVAAVPGPPKLFLGAYDLADLGYTAQEYFISGEAQSYSSAKPLSPDGKWKVRPAARAPYVTRVVVMRPKDGAKFNGTAIVEWLNVSGGLDAPAEWLMAHREMVRSGYALVAVSAQKVGVDGGASMGADMSLKKTDPARYGKLSHPGDAFSYDIFSQAGLLVRNAASNDILGGLSADHVLAAGESQSAYYLTTYVNAVDPLAKLFDGFLIHSRFGSSSALDGSSLLTSPADRFPQDVRFRPDLRAPVLTVQTETDLLDFRLPGYYRARQADMPRLRVWEIAGAAHADTYTVGVGFIDNGKQPLEKIAAAYAPTNNLMGMRVAHPINAAPQHHYVVQAALHALDKWVRNGTPPPRGTPLVLQPGDHPNFVTDEHGMATGGIRSPWADVPLMRTSGTGNGGSPFAGLFGMSAAFSPSEIMRLYSGRKGYMDRFERSLDSAIAKGFILPSDREEILSLAAINFANSTNASRQIPSD